MNIVEKRVLFIFIVIYIVGLCGFLIPSLKSLILPLTPINILAAFCACIAFEKKLNVQTILAFLLIGVFGFFIEYVGVKTGKIFGEYSYGKTLGPNWQGIPYIMGINWMLVILLSNNVSKLISKNKLFSCIIAATIITGYDFILEPVAQAYDFWHWKYGNIPYQNYAAWFIISLLLSYLYQTMHTVVRNRLALGILIIQILFFAAIFLKIKYY